MIQLIGIASFILAMLTSIFLFATSDDADAREAIFIIVCSIAWPLFWVVTIIIGAICFIMSMAKGGG